MIKYSDITRIQNLPADQYRDMYSGRRSFSFIKREIGGESPHFEPTKAMQLGSSVHDILSDCYIGSVITPLFQQALAFAIDIKRTYFKDQFRLLEFEISYLATLTYMGLTLPAIGRIDCEIPKLATIDFKITGATTDKQFANLITYMQYDDQIWNYGNLAQTPKRYLLPYSTKRKCCLGLVEIPKTNRNKFWEDSILKFGTL